MLAVATCSMRRVARHFHSGEARARGSLLREFLPFQKCYYYPYSEHLSVLSFQFPWSVKPILSNAISRNQRWE